ncbi:sal-like protein 2 [Numida meleagris]|uniref:sal-like protein 2 n=1 Tax=Numida meleagris TaxID=8996 RepID=UPI000B3D877D|nr:sal-like protein 2 [Numida meleagris]
MASNTQPTSNTQLMASNTQLMTKNTQLISGNTQPTSTNTQPTSTNTQPASNTQLMTTAVQPLPANTLLLLKAAEGRPTPGDENTPPSRTPKPRTAGWALLGGTPLFWAPAPSETSKLQQLVAKYHTTPPATGGGPRTQCPVCRRVLSCPRGSRLHFGGHVPFRCKVCGRGFSSRGHLRAHFGGHRGVPPNSCPVCQRTFVDGAGLQQPVRGYSGRGLPPHGEGEPCAEPRNEEEGDNSRNKEEEEDGEEEAGEADPRIGGDPPEEEEKEEEEEEEEGRKADRRGRRGRTGSPPRNPGRGTEDTEPPPKKQGKGEK